MPNLFHRLMKRIVLTFRILPILFLCIVNDGQPDSTRHEHALTVNSPAMVNTYNRARQSSYTEQQNSQFGNFPIRAAIFLYPRDGLKNWAAVFTYSPTLEPSTLFLIGIGMVGLAAWGRSHPPSIKKDPIERANETPMLNAQKYIPDGAQSSKLVEDLPLDPRRSELTNHATTGLGLHSH